MPNTNKSRLEDSFPILLGSQWRARGLDEAIVSIDPDALCAEYVALRESAPRRSLAGKGFVKLTDYGLFSAFLHEAKSLKLYIATISELPSFRGESG